MNMEETINVTDEFKHEKCLKKWKPVLDILRKGIFIDIEEEKFQSFMSIYAEYFQRYIDETVYIGGMGQYIPPPLPSYKLGDEIKENLLPINMKALSKLNLRNKNYEIKNGLPLKEIRIPLSYDKFQDVKKAVGLDVVQCLEKHIVNGLSEFINSELESKNIFYLDALMKSITIKMITNKIDNSTYETTYEIIVKSSYQIF